MKAGNSARRVRGRKPLAAICASTAAILMFASLFLWLARPPQSGAGAADSIGGPFSLVDDHGDTVTERSFPGKYLVIYFGYASCRDVCPATMATLAASLDRLGRKAGLIQPLFVTIDPARDTPASLARFVGEFSPRLVGLTGTSAQIAQIADEYKVVRDARPKQGAGIAAGFDHSSVLYIMGRDGKFIAPVPADASEMVMAEAIGRYVM